MSYRKTKKNLTYKDRIFTKSDLKTLRKYLEKYYCNQLDLFANTKDAYLQGLPKTRKTNNDRRFRLKIKPVELMLHQVGSDLMKNVSPSIRQTNTIAARDNGLMQDRGKVLDSLRSTLNRR